MRYFLLVSLFSFPTISFADKMCTPINDTAYVKFGNYTIRLEENIIQYLNFDVKEQISEIKMDNSTFFSPFEVKDLVHFQIEINDYFIEDLGLNVTVNMDLSTKDPENINLEYSYSLPADSNRIVSIWGQQMNCTEK